MGIAIEHWGERPSRHEINMAMAEVIALRGTCIRKQVGCVIVTENNRPISSGYNGSVIKGKHCGELECKIEEKCTHSIHAEQNAISYAAKEGIALEGSTLYCTTAPCYICAKMIYQAGIVRVYYTHAYTDDLGINLLKELGIPIIQLI